MRLYIAGPMTGIDDFNYPAFHDAAKRLRDAGYEVIDPAENFDGDQSLPWATYLRESITQVITCSGIATLPGWEQSRGGKLEVTIADALEMPVRPVAEWLGA